MKKYWKQITITLTVVLLAVAGYLVYAFEFKDYETADEKVDEVTKEKIEVDLPDETKLVVDGEGKVTEEKDEEKKEDKEADTDAKDAAASTDTSATASNNSGSVKTVTASTNSSQTAGASTTGNSSNGKSDSNNGKAVNGNNGNNGNNGSNNGSNNGNNNGSNNGNNNGGNNGNNGSDKGSNNGTDRVTVSKIKARYNTSLERLEDTADTRIDGLVNVAKKEYLADDSPSYAYYYNKYTDAASQLEKNMDAAFYGVIGVMKRDLKANGLAESHVKSVINEYENTKKQRRNALMKKAAGLK